MTAPSPSKSLVELKASGKKVPVGQRQFLPMTMDEVRARGWSELDVVFVTGDAYVDHPSFGAAVISRVLEAAGYRVGIISQPDWKSADAFRALGRPKLFFAITGGNMDSMVNHYTAHKRKRGNDAYTPGGEAGRRPDRATTVYSHRCREAFKDVPVIIGGVEASLRRLAHYDYWDDKVRRSVIFDSKADFIVFGQGEKPILEVARRLADGKSAKEIVDVPGTAYIRKFAKDDPETLADVKQAWPARELLVLPSYDEICACKETYANFSRLYHQEHNADNARLLVQPHGDRAVIVNPPMKNPTTEELDRVYALPYCRAPHPTYKAAIPAWAQIKFSVHMLRGCSAGCSFCCITEHQGRDVASRSEANVLEEVKEITEMPDFKGTISDLGGATANMWQMECSSPEWHAVCRRQSCVYPAICEKLNVDHKPLIDLYRKARAVPGVKHAFVASGLRYDLAHHDEAHGQEYLKELISKHVSGQLKIAPEHVAPAVLKTMKKPGPEQFEEFREEFEKYSAEAGKEQYLVPYFISSHPGCSLEDSAVLHDYLQANNWKPQQVQDFMPTPMTLATDMFYSGFHPFSMKPLHVDRGVEEKRMQKALMRWADPELAPYYDKAMQKLGRKERFAKVGKAARAQAQAAHEQPRAPGPKGKRRG